MYLFQKGCAESLQRRPAVTLAVLLIVGIIGGLFAPLCVKVYFAIAIGGWFLSVLLRRHAVACSLALGVTAIFAGCVTGQLDRSGFSTNHIANFTNDNPVLARLRLRIDDPPRTLIGHWNDSKEIAQADVLAVFSKKSWGPATGKITIDLQKSERSLSLGQQIEALGWLSRPQPPDNPGQFNWLSYYRNDRILANFLITEPACLRVLSTTSFDPLWRFRQAARTLLDRGFQNSDLAARSLLDALVLGDRDPALRPIQDQFIQTGTAYLIVISGLHIFVVAAFVYLLCRLARFRPRVSSLCVIASVLLYGLLVLPSVPPARAVLLCCLTLVGIAFRRSIDLLQLLALCAILVLAIHPMDLTTASFQLSFAAVGILILYGHRLVAWMRTIRADMGGVGGQLPPPPAQNIFWQWTRNALVSTVVAWLAVLPLILYYFNQLNPWSIFCGVALAPFVFVALLAGLAKILLTLSIPPLATLWAGAAIAPINLLEHVLHWMATLPGGQMLIVAPPVWIILLYYTLLLLPLIPLADKWNRLRVSPIAAIGIVLFPWSMAIHQPRDSQLTCAVLSVGAGSCCVLESPDGHVAVIDAGSSTVTDPERIVIKPYLHLRRIRRIDDIFISHPDADHYNAVRDLVGDFPVHEVITDDAFARDAQRSYPARHLLEWLRTMHRAPRIISTGQTIHLGRDVTIQVLWPGRSAHWGDNDDSLVLRITYAGRTILIPGDIESVAERQLINLCPNLASDCLIAPHHGSSVDMTPFFVAAVNPRFVISSNDQTPTSKQMRFEREIGATPLYKTDHCGAVTVTIDKQGKLAVSRFSGTSNR